MRSYRSRKSFSAADLVLISDSSMFGEDIPSICYGLRGLTYMQVEVVGPNKDLHSGSFGGAVHNPIQALAEIICAAARQEWPRDNSRIL